MTTVKTRLLGTDKWVTETTYYDGYAHPIQTVAEHPEKGLRYTRIRYDFTGNVLKRQETLGGGNTLETVYTYDERGRLLTKATTWNGKTSDRLEYAYDAVGRLTGKSYNGKADETLTYNIRGWLTGISSPAFRQTLHYTDGNGTPCYNGNISSLLWKAGSETTERGYTFTYDGLSRLKNAAYGEGAALTGNANRFTEQVTAYDRQGNILGLKRYGQTSASGYGLMDDLTFSYEGNRLKAVSDAVTTAAYNNGFEFRDGAKAAVEYEYDENGNLTKDLNKNISEIQYNCLNLPSRVTFGDCSTFSYLYDASGAKLQTVHTIGGTVTTTDYFGSEVYENGTLVRVLTEDGYVSAGDGKFHYFLQDHQGNNRVVLAQDGTVEEVNHYYPFGGLLSTSSASVQPYKYNGKELDRKNGLDWHDYGARQYDAAIGRWHVVDPMAEKYFRESPYGYCGNNPVVFIDPNGMDYWSTSNPSEIRRFMDVMINNNFGDIKSFDYSSWNHRTDADFLAKLTFNDKKNVFYYNYGTFIDGELTSVGITFPVLRNDINSTTVEPFSFLDYTDFVLSQSSIMIYSEEMGRWLGKNGKFYDFKFNGNQHTGGRNKFAKNLSRKLDKGAKIVGGIQIGLSWNEYFQGNYTLAQSLMDTGFGVFGTWGGKYGAWTEFWYELGKEYGPIHKYLEYRNRKYAR